MVDRLFWSRLDVALGMGLVVLGVLAALRGDRTGAVACGLGLAIGGSELYISYSLTDTSLVLRRGLWTRREIRFDEVRSATTLPPSAKVTGGRNLNFAVIGRPIWTLTVETAGKRETLFFSPSKRLASALRTRTGI